MKKIILQILKLSVVISFLITFGNIYVAAQNNEQTLLKPKPPQNFHSIKQNPRQELSNLNHQILLNKDAYFFSENIQVNQDANNTVNEFSPVIAVSDDGIIYIVWTGDETVKSIFFSKSTDGGKTFSSPLKINDDVTYPPSYSAFQPDIALDGQGNIYVVWHDYRFWFDDQSWTSPIEIFMDKSTDGGSSWGVDSQISSGSGTYPWHFQPYIDIDKSNNYIFVTFNDYDRYYPQGDFCDVSIVSSQDQGATFSTKIRVDDIQDPFVAAQSFSSVAVDSSTHEVYVVFNDSRNSSKDIYIAKSTDFGNSFLSNVLVNTDTLNDQEEPFVRIDKSGQVFVIWKDWRTDSTPKETPYQNNFCISKSTDGGLTFSHAVTINDEYLNAEYDYNFPPKIAIDDNGVINVTWFDYRYNYTNIFYDKSEDGGLTFSQDIIVNDNKDSLSHSLPRMALDKNGRANIVWMDKRNGNNLYDIFFSKQTELTSIKNENETSILREFVLDQNYPNPFNPSTIISWQSPVTSHQTLKIYDMLGNEVVTLVDEYREAGRYEVNFDASRLASGVYFYKLKAGDLSTSTGQGLVSTKKMLLLK